MWPINKMDLISLLLDVTREIQRRLRIMQFLIFVLIPPLICLFHLRDCWIRQSVAAFLMYTIMHMLCLSIVLNLGGMVGWRGLSCWWSSALMGWWGFQLVSTSSRKSPNKELFSRIHSRLSDDFRSILAYCDRCNLAIYRSGVVWAPTQQDNVG